MFSVFLLSLALSVDAFAVAFSNGLSLKKDRFFSSLQIGLSTSIGQFIMPILGWLATDSIHQYIKVFDHWIAFFVFLFLGLNMIRNAFGRDNQQTKAADISFKTLILIGIATSIDACVSGVSLYFMGTSIISAALMIGSICFICTLSGFYISRIFSCLPTCVLQNISGIVLILLGFKILYEHLSLG